MTETSPPSSIPNSPSFDIDGARALVEWIGVDSRPRYLYPSSPDPARQVTFEIRFDAALGAAFFKIRVPVGLKASGFSRAPFMLFIPADRIISLAFDAPDDVADVVRQHVEPKPRRFQFNLDRPGDLVAPLAVSLAVENKSHGDMLDSLKLLAQETRFSVYFTHADLSEAQLLPLCGRSLSSIEQAADVRGYYMGSGAKVLGLAELLTPVLNADPPSYGAVGTSPPGPSKADVESGPASRAGGSSRKRHRGSDSSTTGRPDCDVTATRKMMDTMMSQFRQEERAYLSSQLDQMKTSFSEDLQQLRAGMLEHVSKDLQQLKDEMSEQVGKDLQLLRADMSEHVEHVDEQLTEIEGTICPADELDEYVSRYVSSFEDLIDVKIEDQVMGIKMELEDFVEAEVANAEDRVMARVRDASWVVGIEE